MFVYVCYYYWEDHKNKCFFIFFLNFKMNQLQTLRSVTEKSVENATHFKAATREDKWRHSRMAGRDFGDGFP